MNTPDEILESFPEVTPELMTECNSLFMAYIFYKTKNGERCCECTSCQKKWSYPQRLITDADTPIIEGKHNHDVICPHCGAKAKLKNMGRAKKRQNLTERMKAVFIIPISYDCVYIRCFFAWKSYDREINPPDIEMSETTQYYIELGTALCWKYGYDYTHLGVYLNMNRFILRKNIISPFNSGGGLYGVGGATTYVGAGQIKDTFLKYSQWDSEFGDHHETVRYLCTYAKYPQIEMLVKNGYTDVVKDILCGLKSGGAVNWKATDPCRFFKLSPQELKAYSKTDKSVLLLRVYNKLKSVAPLTFADAEEFIKKIDIWDIDSMVNIVKKYKLSRVKLLNYLSKSHKIKSYSEKVTSYIDYIKMAGSLKYDLKNDVVLYPKNLKKAHDDAVKNYNAMQHAEQIKSMEKLTQRLEKTYGYSNGKFSIIVPQSMDEIIAEGKALSHCVGAYASRHAEGKTVILFLRLSEYPNTPMYTIEMHGTKMRQIQGKGNQTPLTLRAKEFFDVWLSWVEAGSKRDKSGAAIIDSDVEMDVHAPVLALGA